MTRRWAPQTRHMPGPQLGGERGRRPPKQKYRRLNITSLTKISPSMPIKLPFPLRQFQDGGCVFF